ncbi:M20 family metallopeptidase [Desulfurivibrio sp. D14AmB]|uniref:M20 metallopeptidase family protein n=1 Tax=Desulfurivibrio sp. D14AmB TaxID=3374370 RepID=UPI00376EC63F
MNSLPVPDQKLNKWLLQIRRHLHRHPELSGEEHQTCRYIISKLQELGIASRRVHQTGVLAAIGDPAATGSDVALRADLDALPIEEETGLAFASRVPGVMHACGHDGHVAMLLGAAALLRNRRPLPGRVVLIFQPAEEGEGGAEGMIAAGALTGVKAIFAGHIDRHLATGQIAVQAGTICASTDEFTIVVRGRGGHAAKPHETTDSIVIAASLAVNLQSLVARNCDPVQPAVLTIGQIQGGTAANVIAEETRLTGTIRAILPQTRQTLLAGLRRMVKAAALAHGATVDLSITEGCPPLHNDPVASDLARRVAEELLGREQVPGLPSPSLGGEDFARYLQQVPGCMVRFGAGKKRGPKGPAHSSRFDFDEKVLPIGARFLAQTALTATEEL